MYLAHRHSARKPRNPTENVLPDGCCHAHHQRPHQPRGDPQLPNCRIFVNHQTTHAAVDHKCVGNRHHHRKPGRKRTTLPQKRTKTDNLQNNGNDLGVRWECSVRTRLEPDRSSAFEAPFHATEKGQSLAAKIKKALFHATPSKLRENQGFYEKHCDALAPDPDPRKRVLHLILIHENGCCWCPHGFSPARHETFETWKGSGAGENWDSVSNMSQTCCEVCTMDGRTSEKKQHYLTQQKTTKKYRGWLDWWIKTALFDATVAKSTLFNATAPISATPCTWRAIHFRKLEIRGISLPFGRLKLEQSVERHWGI